VIHPSIPTATAHARRRMMPDVMTGATPEIAEFLIQHGQRYIPALLPDDIKRYPAGMCFDASALNAVKSNGKYAYVEGFALDPDNGFYWVLHAWMTDGIHAFDPTWNCTAPDGTPAVLPTMYIGIEMDTLAVATFMRRTTYQGIFGNMWRNPKLAMQAIFSKKFSLPLDTKG
jgi:hypothetical protein